MFPVSKRYHRSVFLFYQNNGLDAKPAVKSVPAFGNLCPKKT